jgi:fructose-1,6-bisphosphatase/inositol monophosphatase family enzyme
VDKKQLLIGFLSKIMLQQMSEIDDLVRRFPKAKIQLKADNTPVTELDLALSNLIEMLMKKHFPHTTFYSEEKFSDWKFPLLALDPLDGTKEYIEGRDEWALSIGIFEDENFKGEGWIYNPKTHECFSEVSKRSHIVKPLYQGEVSRSELGMGLFTVQSQEFEVRPVGSIAYKLGRLSAGKSDFVVSLKPKNIWDIAGGTLLCQQAGLKFYSKGKEVTKVQKTYEPPLIWCHEELFLKLSKTYS